MPSLRLHEPRLPTALEAAFAWLLGIVLVIAAGLGIGAVAAAIGIAEGLAPQAAFAVISDPERSPLVRSPAWISASIALNEVTILCLMLLWHRRLRVPLATILPVAPFSLRAGVGAVLLPFGFAPLAELASELVHRALPQDINSEHVLVTLARGTTPAMLLIVLLAAAVLPAVAEEVMFRGFITTAFQRYSPLLALILASLMFGLFHLEPTQAAGAVLLGTAFGLVRLYTGSIWPCMLSHFGYNAGVILETRWFDPPDDHLIHWGRVGMGLLLAVVAYALLVGDLGRRHLERLSFRPPARGDEGR